MATTMIKPYKSSPDLRTTMQMQNFPPRTSTFPTSLHNANTSASPQLRLQTPQPHQWPEQQLRLPLNLMPSFNFHDEALAGEKLEDHPSQTGFGVGYTGLSFPLAVMTATFSSASEAERNSLQGSRKIKNPNLTHSSAAQPSTKNTSSKAAVGRSVARPLVENPAIRPIRILPLSPSSESGACSLALIANAPSIHLKPVPETLTSHGAFHAHRHPQPEAPSIRKWINSRAMKNFKRASINNLFRQMGRTFREEPHVDRSMPIYEHMFGQLKSAASETANENCTNERAQKVLYTVMSQFRRHQEELWPAKDPAQLSVPQSAQQARRRRHTNHPETASRHQPSTLSPAQMVARYLREEYNIPPSNVGTPTGHPETSDEEPIAISDDSEEQEDTE